MSVPVTAVTKGHPRPQSRAAGFTLVEIMVAMVLAAVLIASLVELFVSTKTNARAAEKLIELQESGRAAMQFVTDDLRRVGYFGGVLDAGLITGSLGTVESASATSPCSASDTTWGRMLDQPLFAIDDPASIDTLYPCIAPAEYLTDDVLVVRYTPAIAIAPAAMTAGRLYVRTGLRSLRAALFTGDAEGAAANDVDDATAEAYPLVAHAYYVGPSGRSCLGSPIPSLWRKALSDTGAPMSQELVPGIERFQVRLLENDRYVDADAVTDWDAVTAVEVQLLARAACAETGFTNDKSFDFGGAVTPAYAPTDGFRRRLFTSVTTIRNRG